MRLSLPRGASHRRRQGQPLACSRIPRRLPRPGLVKGRAEQEDGHSVRIGSVRVNTQKLTLMTGVSMRCDSHCKLVSWPRTSSASVSTSRLSARIRCSTITSPTVHVTVTAVLKRSPDPPTITQLIQPSRTRTGQRAGGSLVCALN